jgi:hypothetical protein
VPGTPTIAGNPRQSAAPRPPTSTTEALQIGDSVRGVFLHRTQEVGGSSPPSSMIRTACRAFAVDGRCAPCRRTVCRIDAKRVICRAFLVVMTAFRGSRRSFAARRVKSLHTAPFRALHRQHGCGWMPADSGTRAVKCLSGRRPGAGRSRAPQLLVFGHDLCRRRAPRLSACRPGCPEPERRDTRRSLVCRQPITTCSTGRLTARLSVVLGSRQRLPIGIEVRDVVVRDAADVAAVGLHRVDLER